MVWYIYLIILRFFFVYTRIQCIFYIAILNGLNILKCYWELSLIGVEISMYGQQTRLTKGT